MVLYFRACPKCKMGTVEHNWDNVGEFLRCLNCGYSKYIGAITVPPESSTGYGNPNNHSRQQIPRD